MFSLSISSGRGVKSVVVYKLLGFTMVFSVGRPAASHGTGVKNNLFKSPDMNTHVFS